MYSDNIKGKISKIKKLKLDNYLNNYFIHRTFYSQYNSPKRITSSPNKFQNFKKNICLSIINNKNSKIFKAKSKSTNRLLGFNTNYNFYSPLITKMMTKGIDSTKYDSTKYTSSKKEKKNSQKKYFGLPGNTPLSPLSNEHTHKIKFKIKNFETIAENDRQTVEEFFIDSFRNKNLKIFSKEKKNSFYDKYNINNHLTIKEENKINNLINKNRNNDYINYKSFPIFKSINSEDSFDNNIHYNTHMHTRALNRLYKDPYNSLKKMKIKNQMMKIIKNLNTNFQYQKYQKEYNNICELNNRINSMKNIKIYQKKRIKTFKGFNAEQYFKDLDSEYSFDDTNKKSSKRRNKKNQILIFNKPRTVYPRGIDLKEVELKLEYVTCIHHPEVRTKSAICFNEEKGELYLFGGLVGKKLADLWIFNFSQIKTGWKKLYEPDNDTDYENEPCPRFGHTIHFYNNKLYIIGGEFTNWKKNDLKEGILCCYDLVSNQWDMMKYNYDIKWYKKKIEERKSAFDMDILSFHEIAKFIENNKNINNINKLKYNKGSSNKLLKSLKSLNNLNNTSDEELNNKIYPNLRKYHISLLIGTHIFLYGGETPSKKVLNDCWIYDIIAEKWSLLDYVGRFPPPLCCHSACLVLEQNQLMNDSLNVYFKPPSEKKTFNLLKNDGVFFFGGYNENKIPTNLFFKMVIGVKPTFFEIPETRGKPPIARIQASMNFNYENNLIVIYGGRNDNLNEVYNDIVLLDMENMCWIHTKFWGDKPLKRSEHNAVVISNKLFVFGGVNNFNFINFDFTIFNLDFFAQKYAQKKEI